MPPHPAGNACTQAARLAMGLQNFQILATPLETSNVRSEIPWGVILIPPAVFFKFSFATEKDTGTKFGDFSLIFIREHCDMCCGLSAGWLLIW